MQAAGVISRLVSSKYLPLLELWFVEVNSWFWWRFVSRILGKAEPYGNPWLCLQLLLRLVSPFVYSTLFILFLIITQRLQNGHWSTEDNTRAVRSRCYRYYCRAPTLNDHGCRQNCTSQWNHVNGMEIRWLLMVAGKWWQGSYVRCVPPGPTHVTSPGWVWHTEGSPQQRGTTSCYVDNWRIGMAICYFGQNYQDHMWYLCDTCRETRQCDHVCGNIKLITKNSEKGKRKKERRKDFQTNV